MINFLVERAHTLISQSFLLYISFVVSIYRIWNWSTLKFQTVLTYKSNKSLYIKKIYIFKYGRIFMNFNKIFNDLFFRRFQMNFVGFFFWGGGGITIFKNK